jgi:SNF2 family DNA or RNA helicase
LRRTRADVFQNYQQPVISMIELDLPIDRREKQFDAEVLVQNPNLILALDGLSEIMREGGIRKVPLALDFIKGKLDDDPSESLVVFAWHKDVAAMLHDGLKDYQPVMVTGETPAADRQKHIDAFQSGEAKVIIGNIATLSEGVDLSRSSTVIFVEATWATSAFEQASARVENIQKLGIAPAVYILTTRNSLDHTILGKVLKKLNIIEQIL